MKLNSFGWLALAASAIVLTVCQKGWASVPPPAANQIVHQSGAEARIMWADAGANFERLSTPEGVRRLVEQCKEANINILALDVKHISGHVLYDSKLAPRKKEHRGVFIEPTFDLLELAVEECRKHGIDIYAAINVFSEGRKMEGGPIFDNPEWESIVYTVQPWITFPGDVGYPVSRSGRRALEGRLSMFLNPSAAGAKRDGETYVLLSADGTEVLGLNVDEVDGEGLLLVGSGPAGEWLTKLTPGMRTDVQSRPRFIPARHSVEMHNAIFVNPIQPSAREYALKIIEEITSNYDVDGIILDRMRYSGLNSDFSEFSRRKFEEWLGEPVRNWPQDIITYPALPSQQEQWGPLFPKWVEWRSQNITDFMADSRELIQSIGPRMRTAVYVGSWYYSYYPMGVNWASDRFRPEAPWVSENFHRTGYAPLADWITTGCYYPTITREEARAKGANEELTVEASAQDSAAFVGNATFTYAGLYVLDYKDNPEDFRRAVEMCRQETQGVMIFDLVYIEDYEWWDILKEAFSEPAPIPHTDPVLRDALRQQYLKSH